jgi:hypothetical protein
MKWQTEDFNSQSTLEDVLSIFDFLDQLAKLNFTEKEDSRLRSLISIAILFQSYLHINQQIELNAIENKNSIDILLSERDLDLDDIPEPKLAKNFSVLKNEKSLDLLNVFKNFAAKYQKTIQSKMEIYQNPEFFILAGRFPYIFNIKNKNDFLM